MTIVNFMIVFTFSWWIVFFMMLPVGVRIPEHVEKGHASSAPAQPKIKKKAIITTIISLIFTLGYFYSLENGYLDVIASFYQ